MESVAIDTLVISIDFGTTYSGYSYSFMNDPAIYEASKYEDEPIRYSKTLTQILYDNTSKKAILWGFSAISFYNEKLDQFKMKEEKDFSYSLMKYFKMGLFNTKDTFKKDANLIRVKEEGKEVVRVKDSNGSNFSVRVITCIEDYLRLLLKKIFSDLEEKKITFERDNIKWCLTVPAIWKDSEKETMRKLAKRVGMIKDTNANEDEFSLILEPEAAAVYCLKTLQIQGTPLKDDETFVIIDAGGGTVDLTSYVWRKGNLAELHHGAGGDCGSSKIDISLLNYIKSLVSLKDWEKFINEYHFLLFEVMMNWEKVKVGLTRYKTCFLEIPKPLQSLIKKNHSKLVNTLGSLAISKRILKRTIFSPVIDKIVKLVGDYEKAIVKNSSIKSLDFFFLVGGFGSSDILFDVLSKEFSNENCKVVRPKKPGRAVVFGATYYAKKPSLLKTRRMRRSYGVAFSQPWNELVHKGKTKVRIAGRSGYFCNSCYSPIVKKNQKVEANSSLSKEFLVADAMAGLLEVTLYTSESEETKFTDHEDCAPIGSITIEVETGIQNRSVKAKMYFGKEELDFEVIDNQTGKHCQAEILYNGTYLKSSAVRKVRKSRPLHMIFIIDCSGSMSEVTHKPSLSTIKNLNNLGVVYESCHAALKILEADKNKHICSAIHFNTSARITIKEQPVNQNLVSILDKISAGGGTNYVSAIEKLDQFLADSKLRSHVPHAIFLSDGDCTNDGTTDKLKSMMSKYSGFTLGTVSVGVEPPLLKEMGDIGKGGYTFYKQWDLDILKNHFQALVSGLLEKQSQ